MLQTLMVLALGASPGPWGDLQLGGVGSYGAGNALQEYTAGASVSFSGFLHHPLAEDDAPLSLQPYLQRAGAIEGSFSYDHDVTDRAELSGPYRVDTVGGGVSLDAYPGELFSLWVSASFFHVQDGGGNTGWQSTVWLLPRVEIGPGVRIDATRLTLGYTYAPTITDGSYDNRGLGQLYLRITTVLAERVNLSVLGELVLSGGRASLELGAFPSRSFGLNGTFQYAEGAIYYWSHLVFREWQGSAGLSWWMTPTVNLGLEYRFIHSEDAAGDPSGLDTVNTHRVALTFRFRLA